MMETAKIPIWTQRLTTFSKALGRLSEVIELSRQKPLNEFERDSLIKRFEFSYEMAWKLMMSFEKATGVSQVLGSRDVIRHAVSIGLIDNGEAWMEMVDTRNQTSHLYDEEMAANVTDTIVYNYHPLFMELQEKLERQRNLETICTD